MSVCLSLSLSLSLYLNFLVLELFFRPFIRFCMLLMQSNIFVCLSSTSSQCKPHLFSFRYAWRRLSFYKYNGRPGITMMWTGFIRLATLLCFFKNKERNILSCYIAFCCLHFVILLHLLLLQSFLSLSLYLNLSVSLSFSLFISLNHAIDIRVN